VIVPRLVATLAPDGAAPVGDGVWGDTRLIVPHDAVASYSNIFTGGTVAVERQDGRSSLRLANVLDRFPIAVLGPAR
jgi:maltooligosyltrehalose synthase